MTRAIVRAVSFAIVTLGVCATFGAGCGNSTGAPYTTAPDADRGDADPETDSGDLDSALPPTARPASVTLQTDAEGIARGGKSTVTWSIDGDATGLELVLRATAPGDASTRAGAHWLSPGTLVPTGRVRYLASDHSWSAPRVAFAKAPASGSVTVTLPSPDEGEWSFAAMLVDPSGATVSAASAAVLVTFEPAMRLSISRLSSSPDDLVHASLALGPGADPTLPVLVTAWLVAPDGSMTTFPEIAPGTVPLYEGPAKSARLELFRRSFATTGLWRVVARMYDAKTRRLLSMAEAGFGVCTGTTHVTGSVRATDGSPLRSSTSVIAGVTAIDTSDHTTVRGKLLDDGTFSLDLAPGSYAILARRVDDTGAYSATLPSLVEVLGCGAAAPAPLTLTAGAPEPISPELLTAIRSSGGALPLLQGFASDGLPAVDIRIAAESNAGSFTSYDLQVLTEVFLSKSVAAAGTDVNFLTFKDMDRLLGFSNLSQAFGSDGNTPILVPNPAAVLNSHFLVVISVGRVAGAQIVSITIKDMDGLNLQQIQRKTDTTPTAAVDAVEAMVPELMGTRADFLALLRSHQPCPITPILAVEGPTGTLPGGALLPIALKATLSESSKPTRHCADRPIGFRIVPPDYALGDSDRLLVSTDANAKASATFSTRGGPGRGRYWATYDGPPKMPPAAEHVYAVTAPAGGASMQTSRVGLFPGESANVVLTLVDGMATPRAGAVVGIGSTLGTVSTATVTTGAAGTGSFTLTAPSTGAGLGSVTATAPSPTMGDVTVTVPFVVLGHVDLQILASSTNVYDTGDALVTGRVLVDGQPARGLTIELSLAGRGTLLERSVATGQDGIFLAHYGAPPIGNGSSTITGRVIVDGVETTTTLSIAYTEIPYSATSGTWVGRILYQGGCGDSRVIRDGEVRLEYLSSQTCEDYVTPCTLMLRPSVGPAWFAPDTPRLDAPFSVVRAAVNLSHAWRQDSSFQLDGTWQYTNTWCSDADMKPVPGGATVYTTPDGLRRTN